MCCPATLPSSNTHAAAQWGQATRTSVRGSGGGRRGEGGGREGEGGGERGEGGGSGPSSSQARPPPPRPARSSARPPARCVHAQGGRASGSRLHLRPLPHRARPAPRPQARAATGCLTRTACSSWLGTGAGAMSHSMPHPPRHWGRSARNALPCAGARTRAKAAWSTSCWMSSAWRPGGSWGSSGPGTFRSPQTRRCSSACSGCCCRCRSHHHLPQLLQRAVLCAHVPCTRNGT